jgi:hypothetical protein
VSLVLNVEILGEFKKLTSATTGATKDLNSLKTTTDKISKGMKTALGAIGLGFSLGVVINELKEASKAAIEDQKSQELLALSLKASTDATDNQIAAVETIIGKYQLAAAVSDDQLRPAFSKLTTSTKDLEESNRLLGIALDVSAGSGKSLDSVTQAMTKALEGSNGALERLVPAVKGVDDPIGFLATQFDGAAEAAANTDPYAKMEVLFGELQEQVGVALLPHLEDFSAWLAEPGTTEMIQEIVDVVVGLIEDFGELVDWAIEYKDVLIPLVATVGTLTVAYKAYSAAMSIVVLRNAAVTASNAALSASNTTLTATASAATTALRLFAAIASVAAVLSLSGDSAQAGTVPSNKPKPPPIPQTPVFPNQPKSGLPGFSGTTTTTAPSVKPTPSGLTLNQTVTVNTVSTSPSAVVSSLQGYQNQTGTNLNTLLGRR